MPPRKLPRAVSSSRQFGRMLFRRAWQVRILTLIENYVVSHNDIMSLVFSGICLSLRIIQHHLVQFVLWRWQRFAHCLWAGRFLDTTAGVEHGRTSQWTLQLFDSPNATLVSLVSAPFLFVSDRLLVTFSRLSSLLRLWWRVCALWPLMCAELTGSGKGHSLFGKDGLIVKTHEYLEVSWFDLMQELCFDIRRGGAKTSWFKDLGWGLKV